MFHSDIDAPGLSLNGHGRRVATTLPPEVTTLAPLPRWVRMCTNPNCPYPSLQIRDFLQPKIPHTTCRCGWVTNLERR